MPNSNRTPEIRQPGAPRRRGLSTNGGGAFFVQGGLPNGRPSFRRGLRRTGDSRNRSLGSTRPAADRRARCTEGLHINRCLGVSALRQETPGAFSPCHPPALLLAARHSPRQGRNGHRFAPIKGETAPRRLRRSSPCVLLYTLSIRHDSYFKILDSGSLKLDGQNSRNRADDKPSSRFRQHGHSWRGRRNSQGQSVGREGAQGWSLRGEVIR